MAVVHTGGAFGAEVVIEGLESVRTALNDVDPKLRKRLDRDLKRAIDVTRETASREVDSQTGETAAGYKVTRREETFRITNTTLGAEILENWRTPHSLQGEHLVATLNEKYGAEGHGRILWDAWMTTRDYVEDQIRRIVEAVEFEIQKELGI